MTCSDLAGDRAGDLAPGSSWGSRLVAETGPVLRQLFAQSVVGMLVFRVGSTGAKVVGANPAAAALLDCRAAGLLGHGWRLRVGAADRARLDRGLRATLDDARCWRTVDLALPDGRAARVTLTAVRSADVVLAHLAAAPQPTAVTTSPAVALNEVVRRAAQWLGPVAEAEAVALEVRVLGRDLATAADPVALERAVLDLLAHAVSSTRVGGRVVATLVREGREVVVAVEDGGAETDPAEEVATFDRFSCSCARSGVGVSPVLGLALVQAVVAGHGGTLDVCSGIGLGTRVVVRLPVWSRPPTA